VSLLALQPYIHMFACISPWIGSTLYHLFMNHSHGEPVYRRLLMGDMLGIWIAQTFGELFSSLLCYLPCVHKLRAVF
jgi:hypothetical protein